MLQWMIDNMYYLLFFTLVIVVNSIGFNLMYKDKMSATEGKWRVKERDLFLVAVFFGAISIYASMHAFKHKLRKYYFKYGIPVLMVANLVMGAGVLLLINLLT